MNIGTITCSYYLRVYGYDRPEGMNWGAMCDKWRAELDEKGFLKLAGEIRDLGYNSIEIWEPTFSFMKYSIEEAKAMRGQLKALGFTSVAYCIGGWSGGSSEVVNSAYQFAQALGAEVVVGCIQNPEKILPVVEAAGKKYGMKYAIENHPKPNLESPEEIAAAIAPYETVGANLDTGIYNMQGYDLQAAYALMKDKTFHVHLKDTVKGQKGGCLPIGDGDAELAWIIKKLAADGYKYMLSVEFEHDGDPTPGLKKSIDYINAQKP